MNRRNFFTSLGTVVVAAPLLSSMKAFGSEMPTFSGHVFPELGYAYNALEPYIDAKTMEIHYSKHHRAYFDNFIKAAQGTDLLNRTLEDIFRTMSSQPAVIRNNAGGFYNHNLFWEIMGPGKIGISSTFKSVIEKDFGSYDEFVKQFGTAARTQFGSGWAWLSVGADGKLFVSSTPNQDNPLMDVAAKQGTPVLGLDVWEHAYYLKYQNLRGDYIDNFWNVVNWKAVEKRYNSLKVK